MLKSPLIRDSMRSIGALGGAYRRGELMPSQLVEALIEAIATSDRDELWISRPADDTLLAQATELDARLARDGASVFESLPLFGVPFAVKDNIDVAGLATTAACPAFSYYPEESAPAVTLLLNAGALLIGKTNLDQFATGLVGTRSPYGVVRNAVNPEFVSGGSSSGSAVAVALGLCSFALGTDTAGSGRVPAGMNGIVGLKPSRGLVSGRGVVPACRSLDCVSVLAGTTMDAWQVLQVLARFDAQDPYSRLLAPMPASRRRLRVGVVRAPAFDEPAASAAFASTLKTLRADTELDWREVDIGALLSAAQLLYEGPWIAERRAALGDFFTAHRDQINPVVAGIIAAGDRFSAADGFRAEYELADYRRQAARLFDDIDVLLVPTTPLHPRIDAVLADPVRINSRLGLYTNFVNLLDMTALALPGHPRSDGLPAGITLIAPAGGDHRLAMLAARFGALLGTEAAGDRDLIAKQPLPFQEPTMQLAVVGAHLDGQPLNWQLIDCGARLRRTTRTSPRYRLYALQGTTPPKPGLVRDERQGAPIEIEIWEMPTRLFGDFMAMVPPPLAIGSLEVEDGSWVKGFICEPCALAEAIEITHHGGWRAYRKAAST